MVKEKPIRRSQLVSPFGVGAMVDFRGPESLMTAGLDAWPFAGDNRSTCKDLVILEERLQARLNVSHFRLPPTYSEQAGPHQECIPVIRFPSWHLCPDCGTMRELGTNGTRTRCKSSICLARRKFGAWLIPVRIIAVCRLGHLRDFPFQEWVHRGPVQDKQSHTLNWRARGASGALSGITISCSCNKSRSLEGAFNFKHNTGGALHKLQIDCDGARPWFLDDGSPNSCGEFLRVVQRGGSNVYFAAVSSSIYLPSEQQDQSPQFHKIIDQIVESLKQKPQEKWEAYVEANADMRNLNFAKVWTAVTKKLNPSNSSARTYISEEDFRREEYAVLRGNELSPGDELILDEIPISDYGQLQNWFSRIRLVKKLRETRALRGFTRLRPFDEALGPPLQKLSLSPKIDWLPATVVRGEGIFLEFDEKTISKWLKHDNGIVETRAAELQKVHAESLQKVSPSVLKINARFLLLHSFAHLLIRELVYECGYGTSALRERIYCAPKSDTSPEMNGLLIYTASGDSEGTMGGLVRQGRPDRLNDTIRNALRRGAWCAVDPVCVESPGQGTNNANLAACHSCSLLPETSCEEGNRSLDRVTVIGYPNDTKLGYFAGLLTEIF